MSIEFRHDDHTKYNTVSIIIKNAMFSLKGCEILEIEDTKYGYQKAVVKLPEQKVDKMKEIEENVNDYLDDQGLDKIKLVYGNKIYAKKKVSTPKKHLERIKLRSVFVNNESKSFAQLWVM